ncbi:DUF3137 domain-containing protein [Eubacterium ruminantium]|uniref:DUF3137 domain-containing protein n=1 Tax=Eubacterium ruminantium TaxID=42322 RepID=UPI002478CF1D|nr:DUF3137 domain-containing protein [Eubacterium ruminantium]
MRNDILREQLMNNMANGGVPGGNNGAPLNNQSSDMGGMPNGMGGAPNGMGGMPNGMGGAPNGMGGMPNGMGGAPNGMGGMPNGMGGAPNGMGGMPNGFAGTPNGYGNQFGPNGNLNNMDSFSTSISMNGSGPGPFNEKNSLPVRGFGGLMNSYLNAGSIFGARNIMLGGALGALSGSAMGIGSNRSAAANNAKRVDVSNYLRTMEGKGLHEKLEILEKARKKSNLTTIVSILAVLALFVGSFFFAGIQRESTSSVVTVFPFLFFIVCIILLIPNKNSISNKRRFKALYKKIFVNDVLQENFQNLYYAWDEGFGAGAVQSFGLCRLGNIFRSEDYICGTYKGVRFETADVLVQQHTNSGKSSSTVTYFKGRMFAIDIPKNVQALIKVIPKGYLYKAGVSNSTKIETENVSFNNMFNIHSSDAHYAFYVLTPDYMERIMYLKQKYNGIMLTIVGNKIFAGIQTQRDSFDANMQKAIDYPTDKARIEADAFVIKDIMDVLEATPKYN